MSKELERLYGYETLSTGDLLRAEIKSGTELGKEISKLIDNGNFAPDSLVIKLIEQRIKSQNCIIDGFPRNLKQAEVFNEMMNKKNIEFQVIYLKIEKEKLFDRISQRVVCPKCGQSYHLKNNPPQQKGLCDFCVDSQLEKRKDDELEFFNMRCNLFEQETYPVIEYYMNQSLLHTLDSEQSIHNQLQSLISIKETL